MQLVRSSMMKTSLYACNGCICGFDDFHSRGTTRVKYTVLLCVASLTSHLKRWHSRYKKVWLGVELGLRPVMSK